MDTFYYLEPEQLEALQKINTALYGNGSKLTPDQRRDLANWMHVVLHEVSKQLEAS